MHDGGILILKGHEVISVLNGRELDIVETVRRAYETHATGGSSLPHSTFLRFPDAEKNRIIALPAYLGSQFEVAGVKWVSSFPGNLQAGMDRASAVLILNSTSTGRPQVVMEGSVISAKRTAASAALAAKYLRHNRSTSTVSMIGCGLINFEVARFLLAVFPGVKNLAVYDTKESQANYFKHKCEEAFDGLKVDVVPDVKTALSCAPLISLATTAVNPHIANLSDCAPGSAILHVSLRDISAEAILGCDNIVDDIDHVCRAQTSVHLAEQLTGTRDFIRCTLSDILLGRDAPVRDEESIAVFSPFGLGVLDVAVAKLVYELGCEKNMGTEIEQFLPSSWAENKVVGAV